MGRIWRKGRFYPRDAVVVSEQNVDGLAADVVECRQPVPRQVDGAERRPAERTCRQLTNGVAAEVQQVDALAERKHVGRKARDRVATELDRAQSR